jgi:hypothetical protein
MTTKIPVELSSTPGIVDGSNATAITIDSSENVGIGVTPSSKLHVVGSEVLFDNTGGDFTLKLNTNAVGDKNEIIMGDTATPLAKFGVGGAADDIITGSDGQDFNIGTAGGGRAINFSTDNFSSVEMKLDGGNVGIGTTSPATILHAKASGDCELRLEAGTNSDARVRFGDATDNDLGYIGFNRNAGYMNFSTVNTSGEAMRIDSNGLLMVGTTATNTHESSGASNEGVVIRPAAFSTWSVSNEICQILNRKTVNGVIMQFNYNGSSVGTISTNANSLPSDRNFKRDIEDLNIGLDLVNKLNPVSYNYKIDNDGTPKMYGLIAQDLEQSLEEVGVDKNSVQLLQHKPNDDEKESDYSLDYLKLTPILIKAIQEQQTIIEDLKTRIETLEG